MKKTEDLPTLLILEGKLEQKIKELEAEKSEVKGRITEVMNDEVYNRKALADAMNQFYHAAGDCSITDEALKFLDIKRTDTGNSGYNVFKHIQTQVDAAAKRLSVRLPDMSLYRYALVHKGCLVTGTCSSPGTSDRIEYTTVKASKKFEELVVLANNKYGGGSDTMCFHPGPWMYSVIQLAAGVRAMCQRNYGEELLKKATKEAALLAPVEF